MPADAAHEPRMTLLVFVLIRYCEAERTATEDGSSQPAHVYIYMDDLEDIKSRDSTTLHVDFQHVYRHDEDLAEAIQEEYYRCVWACHARRVVFMCARATWRVAAFFLVRTCTDG